MNCFAKTKRTRNGQTERPKNSAQTLISLFNSY